MMRNHLIIALTYRPKTLPLTPNVQMGAPHPMYSIRVLKSLPQSSNVRKLKKPPNDLKLKKRANDWKVHSQKFLTRGNTEKYRLVASRGFKALSLRSTWVTITSSQGTKAFTRISLAPQTNLPTCVTSIWTRRTKLSKNWTLSNYFWRKKTLSFLMSSPSTQLSSLIAWWARSFRVVMRFK